MEQDNRVRLNAALTRIKQPSTQLLPTSDLEELKILVAQMAQRYPQDLSGALEGYVQDFMTLALKFGLPAVKTALGNLRIKPGRAFFPRPDEVAEEIEVTKKEQAIEYMRDNPYKPCGQNGCRDGMIFWQYGEMYNGQPLQKSQVTECSCKRDWVSRKRAAGL